MCCNVFCFFCSRFHGWPKTQPNSRLLSSSSRTATYHEQNVLWFVNLDDSGYGHRTFASWRQLGSEHWQTVWILFQQIYTRASSVKLLLLWRFFTVIRIVTRFIKLVLVLIFFCCWFSLVPLFGSLHVGRSKPWFRPTEALILKLRLHWKVVGADIS